MTRFEKIAVSVTLASIASPAMAFSVGAVPEPATWTMMLVGFAAIGWRLRARRSTAAQEKSPPESIEAPTL